MARIKKIVALFAALAALALPARAEPAENTLPDDTFPLLGATDLPSLSVGSRAWITLASAEPDENAEPDFRAYLAGWGIGLADGISLSGAYIAQDLPEWNVPADGEDSPAAWKLALELSQETLGFTGLWLEYAHLDAGFYLPYSETAERSFAWPLSTAGRNFYFSEDTAVWYLAARQQWGSGFSTFQRYAQYDERASAASREWTAGLAYQYRPGLAFELSYSDQDGALDDEAYRNRKVKLRAMVTF